MSLEDIEKPELAVRVLNSHGYSVVSWHPTLDCSGDPDAVGLILPILLKDENEIKVMLRLKSRSAVKELIFALERHMNHVFPGGGTDRAAN